MSTQFIHLRNHSEFSLVDGLLGIKPMVNRIRDLDMPAVALSDKNNFYGLVKFQKTAHNKGIKPIFGSDLIWFSDEDEALEYYLSASYKLVSLELTKKMQKELGLNQPQ